MISQHDRVLRNPSHIRLIWASFVIAYLLTLLPWSGWAVILEPNWLLLVLIHWWLREPWRVGQSAGFFSGLMMDVAQTGILGVSALSFSIAGWLTIKFRTRMLAFSPVAQAPQILPILIGARLVAVLAVWLSSGGSPNWWLLLGSASDFIFWIPITLVLHQQDLRRSHPSP
jgi:rod shape-determining protein MreD